MEPGGLIFLPMRGLPLFITLSAGLALGGCVEAETGTAPENDSAAPSATIGGTGAVFDPEADPLTQSLNATPMSERVATIGLLNKRNNVSQDIEMRPGDQVEQGPVIITLSACERTAPYEFPQETGAFVQVDVLDRGESSHRRVFSGWLFKESPSLNVVEHPIYDVWVKDCAMSFPGDE